MNGVVSTYFVLSLPIFVLGLMQIVYYPLAVWFEMRHRKEPVFDDPEPLVSIVVPAFNEARVLGKCVDSILADRYPKKELILVDDGSSDETLAVMKWYENLPNVTVIGKANGGKASALNAGIAVASGEILAFVDADGIFTPTTISHMLAGFDDERVGAVCGADEPVNLNRMQTRLLALITHVGTGFVRRALARANCVPIVSGNLGAFRRSAVEQAGGFVEGLLGEDLELTWRVHAHHYRVNFCPRATVLAEVPSTLRGLWRQRVRWTRGLIQTVRIHRRMLFNPRYGVFGWFLPINVTAMLVVPVLQLATALLMPLLIVFDRLPAPTSTMAALSLVGLGVALVATLFAIVLDRAWKDLRYLYTLPLWPIYSLMMSVVTVWALVLEARGASAQWNKLERTGVVSRSAVSR
jgi:cellulose synthase/poly-beta-1,6-N-acetylglucosamine synthase-like glycosyltransferase